MAANLPLVWESWNYHEKQNFQNILFPEGLLYDAKQEHYRIEKINCVFGYVAHCSQELLKIKSRFPLKSSEKNGFVPRRRLELPHLTAYAPQAYLYTIPTPGHAILPENNQDKR